MKMVNRGNRMGRGRDPVRRIGFFVFLLLAGVAWGDADGSVSATAIQEGKAPAPAAGGADFGNKPEFTRNAREFQPGTRIFTFMESPGVWAAMSSMVALIDNRLGASCRAKPHVSPLMMGIHRTIEFPHDSRYPSKGLWTVRLKGSRCGNSRIFNLALMAQPGRAPKLIPLVPGDTLTWKSLSLMDDVIKSAIATSAVTGLGNATWKEGRVINSRVTYPRRAQSAGREFPKRWEELWSVAVCGDTVKVPVVFIVNDNSGKAEFFIRVKPGK